MKFFDLEKLKAIQLKYAKLFKESEPKNVEIIAGVDCHYKDDNIFCVAVSMNSEGIITEKAMISGKVYFPYVPTFLAFREGPWMVSAIRKLKHPPDLIFVDGNGRLHPLKAGLAVFVGVKTEISTIGFSKNPMRGLPSACKERIRLIENEGAAVCRKNWKKPIYISPGNLISLESALKIYFEISTNKIPPPLKKAHSIAKAMAKIGL